jgi:transcriptional regulator with XRE-family HTH domain
MDPRDLREAFAANLRRLRHARGISQEGLAHEAGINRSYMSRLEKGASYPGLEIIAKLATVLEVEPVELLRLPQPKGYEAIIEDVRFAEDSPVEGSGLEPSVPRKRPGCRRRSASSSTAFRSRCEIRQPDRPPRRAK